MTPTLRVPQGVAALALAFCATVADAAAAQQRDPGVEAALAGIRDRYTTIQQSVARYDSNVVRYQSPGGSGTVTAYRDGGSLRKLTVRFDGDGASWALEHFYWDDALLFGHRRWERFPEEGPSRVSDDRSYVAEGRVIRWLRTEEDGTRRTVSPADAAFGSGAAAFLAEAACWRRFVEGPAGAEAHC
ncbi:MAG: hypothetical protein HYR48_03020 [Gemmatimonadetes bacterium]|nr:hypothetical protein [Gemmatimonadota bacterium]